MELQSLLQKPLPRTLHQPLRRMMINDAMAKGMAEHCAVEYRNLTEILPDLYHEFGAGR